jgi:acyl-coenzyme A synthetase/AMP-(fatty) acid ligase
MRIHGSTDFGRLPEQVAETHGGIPIWLDEPLHVLPHAGTEIDYLAFARLVVDASGWLHGAGVRPGDRVALLKQNCPDVLALAFAAMRLGAVPALLSPQLDPASVPSMLQRLGAQLLVTDAATASGCLAGMSLPSLAQRTVSVDNAVKDAVSLDELRGTSPPQPRVRRADDGLFIAHTSSTTGVAKLVVHTPGSLLAHVRPQIRFGRTLIRSRDRAAICISWVHTRTISGWLALTALGVPILTLSNPDPQSVRGHLLRHRPTLLESHPNILMRWEALADDPAAPLAGVKLFFSTFDAAHPRTIRKLLGASRRRLPLYIQVYGQSEIGGSTLRIYTRRSARRSAASRSVGRAVPGSTRIRIVSPTTGTPLPVGRPGMIEIASNGALKTYVGQEELATRNRSGPWWRMGDLGCKTRWGTLHLLDREVDAIDGLESSLRIEDLLLERLERLGEVVIVDVPVGPPVPVVCTIDGRPLDPAAWARATADLAPLAAPHQCRLEELPVTGTWKVRRPELRRRLLSGLIPSTP